MRPFFWKKNKLINVYGNLKTINHLKKSQEYLFKKVGIHPPIVKSNIIKSKFYLGKKNEKISFKTIQVTHGATNSVVYIFNKLAYISDSNDLSIINLNILKNLKYLILDCLKFQKHPTHFSLNEAIYIHNKLKPNKTILTNLHHDLDYDYLLRKLPRNVLPAYDGLSLNL